MANQVRNMMEDAKRELDRRKAATVGTVAVLPGLLAYSPQDRSVRTQDSPVGLTRHVRCMVQAHKSLLPLRPLGSAAAPAACITLQPQPQWLWEHVQQMQLQVCIKV